MAPTAVFSENEILNLRRGIEDAERRAAEGRVRADARVAEIRAAGTDPLADAEAFNEIDALYRDSDTAAQEAVDLRARYTRVAEQAGNRGVGPNAPDEQRNALDLAARFVESEPYMRAREIAQGPGGMRAAAKLLADSPVPVMAREHINAWLRSVTMPASPSPLIPDDRRPMVDYPYRPTKVLDLVFFGETDSDLVSYVIEGTPTENAAETAFNVALPESNYTFSTATTSPKRVGHWTPVTEAQLADAAQLRGILNVRLREGVRRRLEAQVLNGNAVGENLRGILQTSGIGTVTKGSAGFVGENALDTIHRAITFCRLGENEPNGVVMHPNDYEQDVVLLKDSTGNYLFKIGEPTSVWGLPAAVTAAITENTGLVGDFQHSIVLARTDVVVLASTEHADFFLKGMVALKAEGRFAHYVDRPAAFCQVASI